MHWQNTGLDNVTSTSAILQVWFGAGLFSSNLIGSFNISFQIVISTGRDQQQIPRTVANAHRWTAIAVGNSKQSFQASAHLFFFQKFLVRQQSSNRKVFLFWLFLIRNHFRLDTDSKIVTPALPTHVEQYSFIDY